MAIDLEAIRRKIDHLNGVKNQNQGNVKLWKPKHGEHRVRVLPWTDVQDGMPFKERHVYFGIGKGSLVSPTSFGKFDPIDEFRKKLFDSKKDDDRALAKKLFPKLQTCVAIIDREAEDEGPQLWILNKVVAKDLMGLFLNAEVGDFTDVGPDGRDILVTITKSAKMFNNRPVNDVKIMPSMKNTPASTDKDKLAKWMGSLPNVDEYYRPVSSEEVKKRFDEWLNSGGVEQMMNPSSGETEREATGAKNTDAIDELAKDLEMDKPKAEEKPKKAEKPKAKKENKEFSNVEDALDDALGDLSDDI